MTVQINAAALYSGFNPSGSPDPVQALKTPDGTSYMSLANPSTTASFNGTISVVAPADAPPINSVVMSAVSSCSLNFAPCASTTFYQFTTTTGGITSIDATHQGGSTGTGFVSYSKTFTTRPPTQSAWTWADFNGMQIGVQATDSGSSTLNIDYLDLTINYVGGATSTSSFTYQVAAGCGTIKNVNDKHGGPKNGSPFDLVGYFLPYFAALALAWHYARKSLLA